MTCEVEAARTWPAKHPDETLDYAVDFEEECVRQWQAWQDFATGVCIRVFRPGQASGYEFRASTGGRSGGRHPAFLTGQPVIDGSVIWTPQAISSASLLRSIAGTPIWTADAGVTVSGESVSDFKALAKIGGGTDAEDYSVEVTAVASDGLQLVTVVILPVRVPQRVCQG